MMDGIGWGGMWSAWIFWLVIIGVIIWAVVTIINKNNSRQQNYFPSEDDALEILKKRYSRGEINREQFEQMKKDLNN